MDFLTLDSEFPSVSTLSATPGLQAAYVPYRYEVVSPCSSTCQQEGQSVHLPKCKTIPLKRDYISCSEPWPLWLQL